MLPASARCYRPAPSMSTASSVLSRVKVPMALLLGRGPTGSVRAPNVGVALGCKVKTLTFAPECRVYRGRVRISEPAESAGVPASTVRYYERVGLRLIEEKQAEIAERMAEFEQFAAQLDTVRAALDAESTPQACRADLTCCVPLAAGVPVAIELRPRH